MLSWTVVVVAQLLLVLVSVKSQDRPEVTVASGRLRGSNEVTTGGRKYAAFKGVPYSKPPLLHRRFKEAEPVDPWDGVWEATLRRSACLQYALVAPGDPAEPVSGEEDCLYLNVFTPKIPTSEESDDSRLLPVLFFIHGGAFMYGAGYRLGPDRLMDRDLVYVTINYRLGILGFLSTEDSVLPGNLGLKDQVAALRWVKDNIAAFGGDPEQVTVAGQSAGGASAQYHFLSPLSEGLFQRGISMSGSVLCPWAKAEAAREKAFRLGEMLGCEVTNSAELISCLEKRPAFQIVDTTRVFQEFIYSPFSPFGPVVEPPSEGAFLSTDPVKALMEGRVQDVPWMVGVTTAEGLYPAAVYVSDPAILPELDDNFSEYFPLIMHYNYTVAPSSLLQETTQRIRKHYLGKRVLAEAFPELVQMVGDWLFVVPIVRASKLQARVNRSPVWFYSYNYRAEFSLSDRLSDTKNDYGVSHADDMAVIINTAFSPELRRQEDRNVARLLLDIFEAFMLTGDPNGRFLQQRWHPEDTNPGASLFLQINSSTETCMVREDNLGEVTFWNSVPDRRAVPIVNGDLRCPKIVC